MRIISGAHKGFRLATPSGSNTRPTSDRVKESLFSMLEGYGVVQAATVLDLFAGSGGLGFEAMSRGAAEVDFVDSAIASARAIKANAEKMGVGHSTHVHSADVTQYLNSLQLRPDGLGSVSGRGAEGHGADPVSAATAAPGAGRIFDLVFMDPPYPLSEDAVSTVLRQLRPCLDDESIIVVERSSRSPEPEMPAGLEVFRSRTFGETAVHFVQRVVETR